MSAPIVSRKHIVQHTTFVVASGTVTTFTDVDAASIQDVGSPNEIVEGNVVKAVYVELWLLSNDNIPASFVMMVEKNPAQNPPPIFTEMTTLDVYENKKNILYTTQGLVADDSSNPTPVLRSWVKIPKGKQRFGLRDAFRINIAAIGTSDLSGCGLTIYKSYS